MTTRTAIRPTVLSAGSLSGNSVKNGAGEDLGKIEEIMLDTDHARIAYAVLSFGGFLGMGDKLFAVPWEALKLDSDDKCFILPVAKERLEQAEGFDKDNWPEFSDPRWGGAIYRHYDIEPYW